MKNDLGLYCCCILLNFLPNITVSQIRCPDVTDPTLILSPETNKVDQPLQKSGFNGSVSDVSDILQKAYVFLYKVKTDSVKQSPVVTDTIMERTNTDGLFKFTDLEEGTYKCVAGHLGYLDTITDILTFHAGKILTVNFTLRKIKKTDYQCPDYPDYIKWSLVGNWQCRKGNFPSFAITEEDWGYAYSMPGNNHRIIYLEPVYKVESDTLFFRPEISLPFRPLFFISGKKGNFILKDLTKKGTIYRKML